jgi:hypothetical protein
MVVSLHALAPFRQRHLCPEGPCISPVLLHQFFSFPELLRKPLLLLLLVLLLLLLPGRVILFLLRQIV